MKFKTIKIKSVTLPITGGEIETVYHEKHDISEIKTTIFFDPPPRTELYNLSKFCEDCTRDNGVFAIVDGRGITISEISKMCLFRDGGNTVFIELSNLKPFARELISSISKLKIDIEEKTDIIRRDISSLNSLRIKNKIFI